MITRRGIFHDLTESIYCATINYNNDNIIYYFSSRKYQEKFVSEHIKKRFEFREYCHKKWLFNFMNMNLLSDLIFYKSLEIRGFRVKYKGREYLCPENLILDGDLKIG